MTFKATTLNTIRIKRAGFAVRTPLRPLDKPFRCILLENETAELLDGSDVETGFPHVAADAIVGRFVAGQLILVSGKSNDNADLEQLEGVDEVWALCFRKPRPGWRLFGRFSEPKVFVGLGAFDRHRLGRRSNYTSVALAMIEKWNEKFPGVEPFRAATLGEYVSGVYRNVDDKTTYD